jgi:uncharacterized protein YpmB
MWKAFKITAGILLAFVVVYGAIILLMALSMVSFAHAEQCTTMTIWQNGKYKVCSVCPTGDGNVVVNCT